MADTPEKFPRLMKKWELWLVVVLAVALTGMAVYGKQRHSEKSYESFIKNARVIQEALDQLAAEKGGYPSDTCGYGRPEGLNTRYMRWKKEWHIDYEVRPNGMGGNFVCLEYCGPEGAVRYQGLCNRPELRRDYPKGQPIPGHVNRIWVIQENAKVLPCPTPTE